jgi:hypothetical protein
MRRLKAIKLENGRIGFINDKGERAFDADFSQASEFQGDLAVVILDDGRYCLINEDGEIHEYI